MVHMYVSLMTSELPYLNNSLNFRNMYTLKVHIHTLMLLLYNYLTQTELNCSCKPALHEFGKCSAHGSACNERLKTGIFSQMGHFSHVTHNLCM